MEYYNPGDTFELDGVWYTIVDQGKRLPSRKEKVNPQPTGTIPEEYIHEDGAVHICVNTRCPNLVPRSKSKGAVRLYCSRICSRKVIQRRQDAKRDGRLHEQRDMKGRLYQVSIRGQLSVKKSREVYEEHLDGLKDRCSEANEASNFHCPGRGNPNCYSEVTWRRYHQGGPWPGVCLIYATLKDHYKTMYYSERAKDTDRVYTVSRGGYWRWLDEDDMLPLPEGVIRR